MRNSANTRISCFRDPKSDGSSSKSCQIASVFFYCTSNMFLLIQKKNQIHSSNHLSVKIHPRVTGESQENPQITQNIRSRILKSGQESSKSCPDRFHIFLLHIKYVFIDSEKISDPKLQPSLRENSPKSDRAICF